MMTMVMVGDDFTITKGVLSRAEEDLRSEPRMDNTEISCAIFLTFPSIDSHIGRRKSLRQLEVPQFSVSVTYRIGRDLRSINCTR